MQCLGLSVGPVKQMRWVLDQSIKVQASMPSSHLMADQKRQQIVQGLWGGLM
jgi:hypothetical protein